MNLNDKDAFAMKEELFQIVKETEQYDFPFLANLSKKRLLIQKRKKEIDERLLGILALYHIDVPPHFLSIDLWEYSEKEARSKFGNISEERMMNGFYFQELMNVYVSNNIKLLDESWYLEINNSRNLDEC